MQEVSKKTFIKMCIFQYLAVLIDFLKKTLYTEQLMNYSIGTQKVLTIQMNILNF